MTDLLLIPPGLIAVTGGERTGKTSFLRRLSGDLPPLPGEAPLPDTLWLDLSLPAHDGETPQQMWSVLRERHPQWQDEWQHEMIEALNLTPHLDKKLYMLSTGSRRKVALVGLLACGATVTCLDQPYAALDSASIRVISEFLIKAAGHPNRSWVVADYVADPRLPWRRVISLD
jgi:ATPase subunit of ABC transporter with duplicated ATPase domains